MEIILLTVFIWTLGTIQHSSLSRRFVGWKRSRFIWDLTRSVILLLSWSIHLNPSGVVIIYLVSCTCTLFQIDFQKDYVVLLFLIHFNWLGIYVRHITWSAANIHIFLNAPYLINPAVWVLWGISGPVSRQQKLLDLFLPLFVWSVKFCLFQLNDIFCMFNYNIWIC